MGSLRRKTFTRPLPDGAELFTAKAKGSPSGRTAEARQKRRP